jgi:Flp pilus assembly protein TadG
MNEAGMSRRRCVRPTRLLDGWRQNSGQTLVEFALASMVFFVTIFGTLQLGLAVWQYNMVANLAQEGARWASVRGSTSSVPATAASLQSFVQGRSLGISVTAAATPVAPGSLSPGETVSVRVQTVFVPFTPLIPMTTITLKSTAKMIMAR